MNDNNSNEYFEASKRLVTQALKSEDDKMLRDIRIMMDIVSDSQERLIKTIKKQLAQTKWKIKL